MKVTRRRFLQNSTYAGASLMIAPSRAGVSPALEDRQLPPYFTGQRLAPAPATDYRPYRSLPATNAHSLTWVQIDLGERLPIDAIELYPASQRMYPGRVQYYAGEGFPLRFKMEAADEPEFSHSVMIADLTDADFPDVQDHITRYPARGVFKRYVRLTATRLRSVKEASQEFNPTGYTPPDSPDFTLTLARMAVLSRGKDVVVGCKSSADPVYGNPHDLGQLTRPAREDGETIHRDFPNQVTSAISWAPAQFRAHAPRSGVTIGDGLFRSVMENNIQYLLDSYTTEDLLRQFYERTGKIQGYKATGLAMFWEEDLAGSNAGRFLMGAGNTVRWIQHPELESRMRAVVDAIDACKQPNGYMMAYPEDTLFYSERGAYTRAWLTHGLLDAGYAGNEKAFSLLRGYYDWFNQQHQYLPELMRRGVQGGQGMIANTRVALSPAGRPADVQVIQRYFEEPAFLAGIAAKDPKQIWQYPYDRPHCYLLTNLEAYMDMYLATGEQRYLDAVLGGWELYHENWEQTGGSISIIEFDDAPPGSHYLHHELGELCGSSFWIFLSQRLHSLYPDEERYAAEIEKSIYNVAIANQDGAYGLRYHTHLQGRKEKATRINTCCEGQGTRLLGSLPEHIYSVAADGIYLNLYAPSAIRWEQDGKSLRLVQDTEFPFATAVKCSIEAASPVQSNLRVRIPSWAAREVEVKVNEAVAGVGKPGTYLALERVWRDGDSIEFTLPMQFRAIRYTGADQIAGRTRFALEYGPILYAAAGAFSAALEPYRSPQEVVKALEPIEGQPMQYRLAEVSGVTFMPYWQIVNEEFACFPSLSNQDA